MTDFQIQGVGYDGRPVLLIHFISGSGKDRHPKYPNLRLAQCAPIWFIPTVGIHGERVLLCPGCNRMKDG